MPPLPQICNATLLITAWKEPKSVAKALEIYASGTHIPQEVIVVCPDEETRTAALRWQQKFPRLSVYTDPGRGKVHALALGTKHASKPILICTDGDVLPDTETIRELFSSIVNSQHGAVTGRPLSLNPRTTQFGYWSHFLVDTAHNLRKSRAEQNTHISLSGYLFAIRTELMPTIPEEILSDDAYISGQLDREGKTIGYAHNANIYVQFPTHYKDWFLQKRRSAGGFRQLKDFIEPKNTMRSFRKEVIYGVRPLYSYPKSIKEFYWTFLLVLARIHLWITITIDQYRGKHNSANLWKRVESTKLDSFPKS